MVNGYEAGMYRDIESIRKAAERIAKALEEANKLAEKRLEMDGWLKQLKEGE